MFADGAGSGVRTGPTVGDNVTTELASSCSINEVACWTLGTDSSCIAPDTSHAVCYLNRTDRTYWRGTGPSVDFSQPTFRYTILDAVGSD